MSAPPVRVAVTGASGFLGRVLVRQLSEAGVPLRALSRRPSPAAVRGVTWVQGDLLDASALHDLIPEAGVVYHLGASLHGTPESIRTSITAGTSQVIAAAHRRGARVLHVSSLSVIDPLDTAAAGVQDESAALDPKPEHRGAYAGAKIGAELLVRNAVERGQDIRIVRPAQIVGSGLPSVPPSVAIGVGHVMLALAGMGTHLPVVHVEDAAAGLRLASEAIDVPSPIHLVDPLQITRARLLEALRRDGVPGSDRAVVPVGGLVPPLAAILGWLPGTEGLHRRIVALRSRARWSSTGATKLGWAPRHLAQWLENAPGER